jgi:riboflavin kinase/FMN adenylyltransferase
MISGSVVRGDGLGRQLGFPTANVRIRHNHPPLSGIFAVEVSGAVEGTQVAPLRGVASLGIRPTVKEHGEPLLEVYLFDFSGDLYGRHLRVHFLHKFRDEQKFVDVAALTTQIAKDTEDAHAYFAALDATGRAAPRAADGSTQ